MVPRGMFSARADSPGCSPLRMLKASFWATKRPQSTTLAEQHSGELRGPCDNPDVLDAVEVWDVRVPVVGVGLEHPTLFVPGHMPERSRDRVYVHVVEIAVVFV